ncbi:MAG: bile acid:sodium symporter, partial [Pontixanthobacter sp.]
GQLLQHSLREWVATRRGLIAWMDRGAIAIAVYVAFSGAVAEGIGSRLDAPGWGVLLALLVSMLVFAFGGAWGISGLLRLARADRISFLFAGAQKSIAMGAPLALILFPPAQAGLILLPLLIYHLLQLVVSAPIAQRLKLQGR